jgi:hypothetical protein
MKKIIFFMFFIFMYGMDINSLMLIEAKLYPKIIKLNECLNKKKNIKIAILYDSESKRYAIKLKKLMKDYNITLIDFNKIISFNYDVYINGAKINKNILNKLIKFKKMIFSLYPNDVSDSMIGLYIDVRILPLINPYIIKEAEININPVIFAISKIYDKEIKSGK